MSTEICRICGEYHLSAGCPTLEFAFKGPFKEPVKPVVLNQEYVGHVVGTDENGYLIRFYVKGKEEAGKSIAEVFYEKSEFDGELLWGDKVSASVRIEKISKE